MKRKYLILMMCLAPALLFAGSLTLGQLKSMALANNPELEMARIDHLSARENARQFHTRRLPSLDFAGSYKYQSVVPELNIPPVDLGFGQPITVFDKPMTLGTQDTYDFSLTLSQPLFTGFQLKNQDKSLHEMADSKELDYHRKKSELIYQVENGYYQLLKTDMIIAISQSAKDQVEAHLKDVRHFYEQGMARKDDVMKAEVKLSETDLSIMQAEHARATALAALENLTGEPLQDVTLDSIVINEALPPVDLPGSLAKAYANRLELKSLKTMQGAASSSVKAARGAYMPTVAAFGKLGYGKPGLDFINKEWMDYWVAGVSAEWSLWNWGKTSSQVQTAKLNVNRVRESINQVEQGIKLDVTRAVLQVDETEQRMRLSEKIVSQNQETFRIVENNYKNGMADNSDYLDVQLDLTRARLNLASAQVDYMIARSNLERAQGTITDQE